MHNNKGLDCFLCTLKPPARLAITALVAALVALGSGACGPRPAAEPGILRIALEASPERLDPRYAMDAHSSRIGGLVFASLTRRRADGLHEPYLARSWRREGKKRWIFELRPDLLFHDGSPVRAADVVATYEHILDPSSASPRRAVLASIASISSPSPVTVVFELARSDAAFMEVTGLGILPETQARAAPLAAGQLIGSGPYRIALGEHGLRLRLEAFAGFVDGPPRLAAIEFKIVPDEIMRALELRHGSVHLVQNAIDPDTVEWMRRSDPALTISQGPSNSFQYLGMNLEHPALAKPEVRRAIAHAIDREAIVEHLLKGQARVASGLLPPHHWAHNGKVPSHRYSPARARRLLDRAGLIDPDGPGPRPRIKLSYKTTTQDLRRRIAEVIRDQLAAVGIEIEVLSFEWGTFYGDIKRGNFHIYSLAWVGITDPDLYRLVFHSEMAPPAGHNRNHYKDSVLDVLLERGARTADPQRRRAIYARVQRHTARTLPYIPLWWPDNVIVMSKRLTGFAPHPSGELDGLAGAEMKAAAAP